MAAKRKVPRTGKRRGPPKGPSLKPWERALLAAEGDLRRDLVAMEKRLMALIERVYGRFARFESIVGDAVKRAKQKETLRLQIEKLTTELNDLQERYGREQ
jgi:hypothetical protein